MVVGPPGLATLVSPSGTTADTTPSYLWNAVAGAEDYLLWVSNITGTPFAVFNKWYTAAKAGCGDGTGTCSKTLSLELAPGVYTWWIQARNGAGTSNWSAGMPFTVDQNIADTSAE